MSQLVVMAVAFAIYLIPALFSREMERSDYLTLLIIPVVMFFVAVLPGVLIWGFDQDAATYLLGLAIVAGVATLNYRSQRRRAEIGGTSGAASSETFAATR